jgi:hypothetical protein
VFFCSHITEYEQIRRGGTFSWAQGRKIPKYGPGHSQSYDSMYFQVRGIYLKSLWVRKILGARYRRENMVHEKYNFEGTRSLGMWRYRWVHTCNITSYRDTASWQCGWDLWPRNVSKVGYLLTLRARSGSCRYLAITSKGWYGYGLSRSGRATWHVTTVRSSHLHMFMVHLAPVTNWEPHGITLAGHCYAMRYRMKVQVITPFHVSHLQHYGVMERCNVTSVYPPYHSPSGSQHLAGTVIYGKTGNNLLHDRAIRPRRLKCSAALQCKLQNLHKTIDIQNFGSKYIIRNTKLVAWLFWFINYCSNLFQPWFLGFFREVKTCWSSN